MHVANFRKAGIVVGAYHFGVGAKQASIPAQVAAFAKASTGADVLILDLERNSRVRRTVDGKLVWVQLPTMTRTEGREFIRRLRAAVPAKPTLLAAPILLYSSRGTWPGELGQDANWVADYTGDPNRPGVSPRIPWAFWQWTSTPWDKNRFNGDLAALRKLASFASPPPQPAPEEDQDVRVVVVREREWPAPRRFTAPGPLRRFSATEEIEPPIAPGYAGWADASVAIESSGVPHGAGFLRLSSGGSAGKYVLAAQVALDGD
jgi:hypothetical protein